jgi:hypothetical protein
MNIPLSGTYLLKNPTPDYDPVVSGVNLLRFVDNPDRKIVFAVIEELYYPVVLWNGATYDAEGDYTKNRLSNRTRNVIRNKRAELYTGQPIPSGI